MNVYIYTDIHGRYSSGMVSLIVAKNKKEARVLLNQRLEESRRGLNNATTCPLDRISLSKKHVVILTDGE